MNNYPNIYSDKTFTVMDILFLLAPRVDIIQIYYCGWTYQFQVDMLPDFIFDTPVGSIDNPEYQRDAHPLCINIDPEQDEELYQTYYLDFADKFEDFEI